MNYKITSITDLTWQCLWYVVFECYLSLVASLFFMVQVYKLDGTMAAGEPVKVSVVTDKVVNVINCSKDLTAEELCIILCKKNKIPPITRTLFALRVRGKNYFLKDNFKVLNSTRDYELRIRFKVMLIILLANTFIN